MRHPDDFTPDIIQEPKSKSRSRNWMQILTLVLAALALLVSLIVAAIVIYQVLNSSSRVAEDGTPTPTRAAVAFVPTWTPSPSPTSFILPTNTPTATPTTTPTATETPTPVPTDTPVPPTATTRPFIPPPPTRTPAPPTATPTITPIPYAFAVDGPPSIDKNRVCQSQLIVYGIVHDKDYRGLVGVRLRQVPKYGNPPELAAITRSATKANDPIKTPDGYYELIMGTSTNDWDIFVVDENDKPISEPLHMHIEADVTGECWWNVNWHQN